MGVRSISKNELGVVLDYSNFNPLYSFEIKVPYLVIVYSRNIVV